MRAISYAQARARNSTQMLSLARVATPFSLDEGDRFFFIGTCICRQMEHALRARGLNVLSTAPAYPAGDNKLVGMSIHDKYYVQSILQELAWALGRATFPLESIVEMPRNTYADLQVPRAIHPVAREHALARREILRNYFARIVDANVIVVELTGADQWFDRATRLGLNGEPPDWAARREPDRFEYQLWRYDDHYRALTELRSVLRDVAPTMRLVGIVNPGGLERTYRDADIETVSGLFASTIRTALGNLADEFDDVAYFPTFEAFMNGPANEVFEGNRVRAPVLDAAMSAMLHSFGIDRPVSDPDYDEAAYLRANPDVAASVKSGHIPYGYHHWFAQGRAEGRGLTTPDCPTDEPIAAEDLRTTIHATPPGSVETRMRIAIPVTVTNTGGTSFASFGRYPVYFCYRWYDQDGTERETGRSMHTSLAGTLGPGETSSFDAWIMTPESAGTYTLALTLLQSNVAWFDDIDVKNGFRCAVIAKSSDMPPARQHRDGLRF